MIASLAVGASGFAAGSLGAHGYAPESTLYSISAWLGLLWVLLAAAGAFVHRWRALFLLTGAPLALFWPAALAMIVLGCAHDRMMCP
jgi:hypothetical protein